MANNYIVPKHKVYMLEGKYPLGSIFVDNGENKYIKSNKDVLFYNTTKSIFGIIDREILVLSRSNCPEGYTEYILDSDRLLVTGETKDIFGTDDINNSFSHTHELTIQTSNGTGTGHDKVKQEDYTVSTDNTVKLSEYVKFRLCIVDDKYIYPKGRYE